MELRETYETQVKARMKALDAQIADLTARLDESTDQMQDEYRSRLTELKSQRDEAQRKVGDLQNASDAAWQDLRAGVELAMTALTDAVESARTRFSSENEPHVA